MMPSYCRWPPLSHLATFSVPPASRKEQQNVKQGNWRIFFLWNKKKFDFWFSLLLTFLGSVGRAAGMLNYGPSPKMRCISVAEKMPNPRRHRQRSASLPTPCRRKRGSLSPITMLAFPRRQLCTRRRMPRTVAAEAVVALCTTSR